MNRFVPLTSVALCLLLSGCKEASTVDTSKDKDVILQLEDAQMKNFNAKNVPALLAGYADDATMIVAGGPSAKGKQTLEGALKSMVSDPAFSLQFHAYDVKVASSGDLAYTEGTYTLTVTNPATHQPMTDKGSYVTTYVKAVDGAWKLKTDAIITQTPPPAPAPQK